MTPIHLSIEANSGGQYHAKILYCDIAACPPSAARSCGSLGRHTVNYLVPSGSTRQQDLLQL